MIKISSPSQMEQLLLRCVRPLKQVKLPAEVYGRKDVNVLFDYDLTRSFTPDMRVADKAGYLKNVTLA